MLILIIVLSGCLASAMYLHFTQRRIKFGRWLLWMSVFSLLAGVGISAIAYFYGVSSPIAFMSTSKSIVKTWLLGIALAVCFAFLFFVANERKRREIKGALWEWKGHIFFPFFAFKYFLVIFLCALFLCVAIEYALTPYTQWTEENTKIQSRINAIKLNNVTKMLPNGYPLWKLGDEEVVNKEGAARILVIGDSFVWGHGYDNFNYLWWKRLQRGLDERGYNCQVYGVGRCGASTQDQMNWLMKTSLLGDISPDIIIFGYVTNDAQRIENGVWLPRRFKGERDLLTHFPPTLLSKCFPNMAYLLNQKVDAKWRRQTVFTEKTGYPYEEWELAIISGSNLERYKRKAIYPLGNFLAGTGIPVLLLTNPIIADKEYYELRYENVLPEFEKAGFIVYNMLNEYLEYLGNVGTNNMWINPVNSHPGTATTKFYADYVMDILERDYPQILRKQAEQKYDETKSFVINDWMPMALMPEKVENGKYNFLYPNAGKSDSFLHLRAGEDYVKLSFQYPINISELTILGGTCKAWIYG